MKRIIIAAGILGVLVTGREGTAKTLEEVLKEKGVITEADYAAVTKSKPLDYKVGEGFTFISGDEKFKLSLGSSMQFRYTFLDKDDVNSPQTDQSEFRLKRIKMFMNGYAYSKELTYKLQMNLVEANSGKFLEETWMNYRFMDEAQIRFGQDKVQFARQFILPSTAQQFVDSSIVTDAFKPGYDTGLAINGRLADGVLNYTLGVYGGVGQNTFRTTNDNALSARIVCNPLGDMKNSEGDTDNSQTPLLSIGASYFMDTLTKTTSGAPAVASFETNNLGFGDSSKGWLGKGINTFAGSEKVDINTYGVDAAFKWQGFSAQGEYFMGQADGQTSNKTLRAHGFYAQTGYFIIPEHLEVAARYGYLDPNRDVANDHQIESAGAVSYYFSKHNLKLQADYTNIHKQAAPNKTDDGQFRLQAQIIF